MTANLRVCFVGDSFTQGVGDPEYRGWVGRVLQATPGEITAFNLGIRRNTSEDILRRCRPELDARTLPDADNRLVLSFGSNDAIEEDGAVRVDPARCLDNLATLLDDAERRGTAALVVGPPPCIGVGAEHLERLLKLSEEMAALCARWGVPFVPVTRALADDARWTAEAMAGDGVHPGVGGYARLAQLVLDSGWVEWVGSRR
ncbi:GDSL-type esterase/lipase family protein [Kitasatospora sp. MAP5-34]|uniref:GDSL-type esterase/lipase family protein n=1 Tax=Kitasatospora sp. MAP5-34 TaxID=3035102 RepID=UPI0024763400|nr:GDSL-type esterase/lipase family protein [Kitasatospora sp. MAP5-34]MDH6576282.1 acyl-CoA thioesterase-1 [Kitasatospora sp. MAP5-34]